MSNEQRVKVVACNVGQYTLPLSLSKVLADFNHLGGSLWCPSLSYDPLNLVLPSYYMNNPYKSLVFVHK